MARPKILVGVSGSRPLISSIVGTSTRLVRMTMAWASRLAGGRLGSIAAAA